MTVSTPPLIADSSTLSTPPLVIDLTEEASAASVSLLNDPIFENIEDSDVEVDSPKAEEKPDGNGAGEKSFEDTVSAESSLIAFRPRPPPQLCPGKASDTIEDTEDTVPYDVDTYMESEAPGSPELIPSVALSTLSRQLPVNNSPNSRVGKEMAPTIPASQDLTSAEVTEGKQRLSLTLWDLGLFKVACALGL